MTDADEDIIKALIYAIFASAPPGAVGEYHARLYAQAALDKLRELGLMN